MTVDPEKVTDLQQAVVEEIERAMDRVKIHRSELARRLGKPPSYSSQVLSGKRNLTLRVLAEIAGALGMTVTIRIERSP